MQPLCSLKVEEPTLDGLWAAWSAYEQRYGAVSPFQTPHFAQCWLSHFGKDLIPRPLVVLADTHPVGIFPFVQSSSPTPIISLMGDINTADYVDCPVASDPEAAWVAVLAHMANSYEEPFIIRCPAVPGWSPNLPTLTDLATRLGMRLSTKLVDVSPIIELPSSWEEYLASLDKHDRHELRRKLRRAEAGGKLDVVLHRAADDLVLDTFLELMKASSPEKRAYLTPIREGLFRCVVRNMSARSALRLYELLFNGRTAASILCFEVNSTLFLYNSGYDPALSHFSLGYILVALSIRDAIQRGLKRYDFLRGGERYKYDLGGKDTEITEVQLEVPERAVRSLREFARCRSC